MSNLHNQEQLENQFETILDQLLNQDRKGLIDDEIKTVARNYGLDKDDDRDEIINFLAEFILYDMNTAQEDKLTGKGSGRRKEDINKIRNNWDSVFGKKKKKQITEVTIEFTMEGNPTLYDMKKEVEKMCKENKIVCTTLTKYINA